MENNHKVEEVENFLPANRVSKNTLHIQLSWKDIFITTIPKKGCCKKANVMDRPKVILDNV